jgi:hypothetical protein
VLSRLLAQSPTLTIATFSAEEFRLSKNLPFFIARFGINLRKMKRWEPCEMIGLSY